VDVDAVGAEAEDGRLLSHAAVPDEDVGAAVLGAQQPVGLVKREKAVGDPPLLLYVRNKSTVFFESLTTFKTIFFLERVSGPLSVTRCPRSRPSWRRAME